MTSGLRDARLRRGWSQMRLISELQAVAARRGAALPETPVLKTQISRWENGRRVPDEFYRGLLQDALDLSAPELGFPSVADPDHTFSGSTPLSKTVSSGLLQTLEASLAQLASLDAAVGPRTVLALAREQARFMTGFVRGATGSERTDVLRVATRLSEFTGWLHQDAGELEEAMAWTDRAIQLANEAGTPELAAYVAMRRSNIDSDRRDTRAALDHASAAVGTASIVDPQLSGVLLRQRAMAHALVGDEVACRRDLDDALQVVLTHGAAPESASLVPYVTSSYIEMEAANCYLRLGKHSDALDILNRSIAAWPAGTQERDRGLALARLATAYAGAHEVEEAVNTGHAALKVLEVTRSARILTQMHDLRRELAPVWDTPAVRNFNRAFKETTAWKA